MAVRLKSISELAPWSLVVKTIIFSAAWYFLPFWVFLLISLYFYFSPAFQSGRFLPPLLTTLYLAFVNQPTTWFAILFGLIFYLTVGIKDLTFINRKEPYAILICVLLFLLLTNFWSADFLWHGNVLLKSTIIPLVFFFLVKDYLNEWGRFEPKQKFLILSLASFLIWQFSLALLFLPLNLIYLPLILLIVSIMFLEIIPDYLNGKLTKQKRLAIFSLLCVLIIFILGSLELKI